MCEVVNTNGMKFYHFVWNFGCVVCESLELLLLFITVSLLLEHNIISL